jgi:NAD(P)-dependent dehydrogenase (short-subunit alcohol dehydrogenase family)
MMSKSSGKLALITGGSSSIGLAAAQAFISVGAFVYITGRRQEELDKARGRLGANVATLQGDVSKLDDLDRLYDRIKADNDDHAAVKPCSRRQKLSLSHREPGRKPLASDSMQGGGCCLVAFASHVDLE